MSNATHLEFGFLGLIWMVAGIVFLLGFLWGALLVLKLRIYLRPQAKVATLTMNFNDECCV